MELQTITIKEYLSRKNIPFKERNGEVVSRCLFNGCDDDSKSGEAHLYFNVATGQYDCKKCGEKGNIITLAKRLGDDLQEITIKGCLQNARRKRNTNLDSEVVERFHKALPSGIREYLNARGIPDAVIDEYKLGWGSFYGKWWITIPIADKEGKYQFLKLRKDPGDEGNPDKYKSYPVGSSVSLFGREMLEGNEDAVVIAEGEFDALVLIANGVPAISSTGGAGTFRKEWLVSVKPLKKIYVGYDKDDAGRNGSERVIKMLAEACPKAALFKIELPDRMAEGKDITDYFTKYGGNPDELIYQLAKPVGGKQPVDASKFKPLTSAELVNTLGLTIKQDEENKLIAFLCQLSAYTENCQFNISFNAPSSTGKSYIPTEIAGLFPESDVIEIGYCSPTAFFHDIGEFNKERKGYEIDLSRKILIFLDQPHTLLLERLRPLLSHDKKEMQMKITDKSQKGSLRTKNVFIKGYPSVIFCSAGLRIDEQEGTRFLLLSPQTNQEKIRLAILERIRKESDSRAYHSWLEGNPDRLLLKQRIEAIKAESIDDIKIATPELIESAFLDNKDVLKPRHQRDIGRLMTLVKSFALLNLWFRQREDSTIIANGDDVAEALKIWDKLSESQEYNLPPYIFNLFNEIILTAWKLKNPDENAPDKQYLTRQDIINQHFKVYGRMLPDWQLRQQILPMLETAGLIAQEPDPSDKRKMLIYPTTQLTNSKIVSGTGGLSLT